MKCKTKAQCDKSGCLHDLTVFMPLMQGTALVAQAPDEGMLGDTGTLHHVTQPKTWGRAKTGIPVLPSSRDDTRGIVRATLERRQQAQHETKCLSCPRWIHWP